MLVGPAGTAAAYRRGAWEPVEGLDERIFAYGEDFDLAVRLRVAGWATAAAPDAVGVHLRPATHGHRARGSVVTAASGAASHASLRAAARPRRIRAAVTEAIVVAGDAVISRDLAALHGRLAGWRAAGGLPLGPCRQRRPSTPASGSGGRSICDGVCMPNPSDTRRAQARLLARSRRKPPGEAA